MKISKTLQNAELTEKVLDELEDVIMSVCEEVVSSIDMQLQKGDACLDETQQISLRDHLRKKVNLNLTINAGIRISELANLDIYPRDIYTKKLDSFVTEDDVILTAKEEADIERVMDGLDTKVAEELKKGNDMALKTNQAEREKVLEGYEEFRAERKKRMEEQI